MMLPKEYQGLQIKREDAARWSFLCPFHDDHNPSLTVNKTGPYAGNFRCWGCGAKGSPATFARKMGETPSTPFPPANFKKTLPENPAIDPEQLARLFVQYRQYPDKRVYHKLGEKLGINPAILHRFYVGFDGKAYTFPMFGLGGEIVGIRLRTIDGKKYALKGGRNGLFVPCCVYNPGYPLIVTEGESDALAAFQMGFQVVGLPGKGQCKEILAGWMTEHGFTKAVLIADNDDVGQTGAKDLAKYLAFEQGFEIRMIQPPKPHKDFRDWFNAGAKRSEVLDRIEDAQYHIGMDIVKGIKRIKITYGGTETNDNV
jgi:hypothetical protein